MATSILFVVLIDDKKRFLCDDHHLQVLAFVAPKIIGGVLAPSPVGELGMVEMTQALNLSDVEFEKVWLQPL